MLVTIKTTRHRGIFVDGVIHCWIFLVKLDGNDVHFSSKTTHNLKTIWTLDPLFFIKKWVSENWVPTPKSRALWNLTSPCFVHILWINPPLFVNKPNSTKLQTPQCLLFNSLLLKSLKSQLLGIYLKVITHTETRSLPSYRPAAKLAG